MKGPPGARKLAGGAADAAPSAKPRWGRRGRDVPAGYASADLGTTRCPPDLWLRILEAISARYGKQ